MTDCDTVRRRSRAHTGGNPVPGGARPVLAWVCVVAMAATAAAQTRPLHLADVRRIHVAELGSSEAARTARTVLSERLESAGFRVVDGREDADAMLSGTVVTRARGEDGAVVLFETVVLQSPEGTNLWHAKFRPGGSPDAQARRIAKTLRRAVERAVWRLSRETSP